MTLQGSQFLYRDQATRGSFMPPTSFVRHQDGPCATLVAFCDAISEEPLPEIPITGNQRFDQKKGQTLNSWVKFFSYHPTILFGNSPPQTLSVMNFSKWHTSQIIIKLRRFSPPFHTNKSRLSSCLGVHWSLLISRILSIPLGKHRDMGQISQIEIIPPKLGWLDSLRRLRTKHWK